MKSPGALENIASVKTKGHEKKIDIPMTERLKSIPEVFGIRVNEEASYQVIKEDGDFEIRRYDSQVLAEVTLKGLSFDDFREKAFEKLAAYIFGENISKETLGQKTSEPQIRREYKKHSETLAMTAPVLQEEGFNQEWTMSFVLPKKLTLQTSPQPIDDQVKLREVAPYEAAVIRYSGTNSIEAVKEHEAKLAEWIKSQSDLQINGPFFSAQYDAPFVIPFLRRNEVMAKLTRLQS